MSLKPKEIPWPAPPHTLAKIAILKSYLTAYFPILGMSRREQDLLYIDGFAGPGEYTNDPEGSPIAALNAAIATRSTLGEQWKAGIIRCAFIEKDRNCFSNLQGRLEGHKNNQLIQNGLVEIHTQNCTFVEGMPTIKNLVPEAFSENWPLFAFIDPFGATGVPFSSVSEILQSPCSEVLINLDADGIARIFLADNLNREETLTSIFGDESWREHFLSGLSMSDLCQKVLELYKKKLRALHRVRYIFAFEMLSASERLNYYLVFASRHPLGLEKMKEAMKRIDQDGRFRFCDAHIGQEKMFRFDAPEDWTEQMHRQFASRRVIYEEIRDYTLNETPFINPSKVLGLLEKSNLIIHVEYKGERRRGAFAPEKTTSITFK